MRYPRSAVLKVMLLPLLLLTITALACNSVPTSVRETFPSDTPVTTSAAASDLLIYPQEVPAMRFGWHSWGPDDSGLIDRRSSDTGYERKTTNLWGPSAFVEQYTVIYPNENLAAERWYLAQNSTIAYASPFARAQRTEVLPLGDLHAPHAANEHYSCESFPVDVHVACRALLRYGPVVTTIIYQGQTRANMDVALFAEVIAAADARHEPVWNKGVKPLAPLPTSAPSNPLRYIR